MTTPVPPRRPEEMGAGRELDLRVAEKVMAYPINYEAARALIQRGGSLYLDGGTARTECCAQSFQVEPRLPHYSTDIKAAWEVVEKLSMTYQIKVGSDATALAWWCDIGDGGWRSIGQKTAALAICKAALLAMEAA